MIVPTRGSSAADRNARTSWPLRSTPDALPCVIAAFSPVSDKVRRWRRVRGPNPFEPPAAIAGRPMRRQGSRRPPRTRRAGTGPAYWREKTKQSAPPAEAATQSDLLDIGAAPRRGHSGRMFGGNEEAMSAQAQGGADRSASDLGPLLRRCPEMHPLPLRIGVSEHLTPTCQRAGIAGRLGRTR